MSVHISAKPSDIARVVIMPGDPLRAKYIAEKYLSEAVLINDVRMNLGYTGFYEDTKVTVMASGMGMASMGIYAHELFTIYDVDKIIRVGSCGSYHEEIKLRDLILVEKSFTLSNFAYQEGGKAIDIAKASSFLNQTILERAHKKEIDIKMGTINCSDVFYHDYEDERIKENYCLGVEMESFSLFYIATKLNKEAACILTVSDNLVTKEELSSTDREQTFDAAITLVLDSIK